MGMANSPTKSPFLTADFGALILLNEKKLSRWLVTWAYGS